MKKLRGIIAVFFLLVMGLGFSSCIIRIPRRGKKNTKVIRVKETKKGKTIITK